MSGASGGSSTWTGAGTETAAAKVKPRGQVRPGPKGDDRLDWPACCCVAWAVRCLGGATATHGAAWRDRHDAMPTSARPVAALDQKSSLSVKVTDVVVETHGGVS